VHLHDGAPRLPAPAVLLLLLVVLSLATAIALWTAHMRLARADPLWALAPVPVAALAAFLPALRILGPAARLLPRAQAALLLVAAASVVALMAAGIAWAVAVGRVRRLCCCDAHVAAPALVRRRRRGRGRGAEGGRMEGIEEEREGEGEEDGVLGGWQVVDA
jgi:hypothetical protein